MKQENILIKPIRIIWKNVTHGSVLDWLDSGAGFVIPDLKVQKSFYLGTSFSIFTSELYAILMALNHNCNIPLEAFNILICVDSKSALYALQNWRDIVYGSKISDSLYPM